VEDSESGLEPENVDIDAINRRASEKTGAFEENSLKKGS
jgi:hypothetical protein